MATTETTHDPSKKVPKGRLIGAAAILAVLGAIALDTTVVRIGSEQDAREQAFNPDAFGDAEFPRIRDTVIDRAAEAAQLSADLAADKSTAVAAHGTMAGAFPVMAASVTGTVGEGKSGIFTIDVPELSDVTVRVQTGPAINGTELRDFPGDIAFGAFKNQIEYQDAGSGINRAMANAVLADLDREALTGKTIEVTGAFTLINPKNWLLTPVALEVK